MGEPTPERWLPVVGYEGFYEVSDLGRVRSLPHYDRWRRLYPGKIRKSHTAGSGYVSVMLSRFGEVRNHYVHRLVARAFIGPCPEGEEVLHGDDDKANNRLGNLCYDTHRRNAGQTAERDRSAFGQRNGNVKLTEAQVAEIRAARAAGVMGTVLAKQYGISKAQVSRIGLGRNWEREPDADPHKRKTGRSPLQRVLRGQQHPKAKLTDDDVRAIREARAAGAGSTELARQYSVSQPTISSIVHRRVWGHVD